jgi:4-aminobutyrate---pyruvate transaminase
MQARRETWAGPIRASRKSFDPGAGVSAYVGARAQARGVITRCLGDNVNLCPPLIIGEAEISDLMGRIKLALDDALEWVENGMQSP